MAKLRFRAAISLDGYVAGPNQSVENPLGVGGTRLHQWAFPLAVWRAQHGLDGGKVNESTPIVEEALTNVGATLMGRHMFGGPPGPWDTAKPWNGWWPVEPPYHHPVSVLTHHPRAPLTIGETTFHFVTDGIVAALAQAKEAAGGRDVVLGGGASVAQQYLAADLVDEMELHLVPILLGSGERLFERVGDDLHGLTHVRTVSAPGVTHLKFVRG